MQLGTSEFERALKAVSEGSQSLDSLLTVLSREEKDQELVHKLKAEGYQSLARTLAEYHTE